MINRDQLTTCPKCGCDGCYVAPISEFANSYLCWGCGFNTTDLMKEGEYDLEEMELALPELYKDLAYVDQEGRKWYPTTINIPERGTVFITGKHVGDWQWAGILSREATEEEAEKLKHIGQQYMSDSKTLRTFGNDFIEACDYVGIFKL